MRNTIYSTGPEVHAPQKNFPLKGGQIQIVLYERSSSGAYSNVVPQIARIECRSEAIQPGGGSDVGDTDDTDSVVVSSWALSFLLMLSFLLLLLLWVDYGDSMEFLRVEGRRC